MASVINTNMASLYAQKNLSGAQNALSTSVERLSSGLRINRAKDDAAGLGISEKIKSQVTSLNQGLRNANDAISMVQTAEGSLSEVSSILQRMKELSVQARNDSLSTTQRSFISDELVALKNEINSIAERTTFNDLSLLKNALRTQVSVPALADATKITNGASLLSGVSVSGLSVNNTNVGTYTLTTGTQAPIANQISEAAGKFGGNQVDVLTLSGTWEATDDSITVNIAIEGGETLEVTYVVAAADFNSSGNATGNAAAEGTDDLLINSNIATGLAAAINVAAQEASGVPIAARAVGDKIYLGGADDSVTLTTTVTVTDGDAVDSGAVAVSTGGTAAPIDQAARVLTINIEDAVEGNKFTLSINGKEYSVVAGSGSSTNEIAREVADNLRELVKADYPGVDPQIYDADRGTYFTFDAGAGLGVADMSMSVSRLVDGKAIESVLSTVSPASLTTANTERTLTINDFDVIEGRKATVRVGNPDNYSEYSTVVGASDTAASIAVKLEALLDDNFSTSMATAAVQESFVVTFAGTEVGSDTVIRFDGFEMTIAAANDGAVADAIEAAQDFKTAYELNDDRAWDVTVGAGGAATFTARAAYAGERRDILASDFLITDVGGNDTTALSVSVASPATQGSASNQIVFADSNNLGMSNISIEFTEMVEGAVIDASSEVSAKNHAQNDRTITINRMDLSPGNVVSVEVAGKEYAVKVAESDDENDVAYKLSQLLSVDYPGAVIAPDVTTDTDAATFSANGMKRGDSITIAGLTFHASKDVTAEEVASAFTIVAADPDGSEEIANKYGYFTGRLDADFDDGVLLSTDTVDFATAFASGDVEVRRAVSVSSNVITLSQGLELGLEDISVTVKTITDPGKLTLTANADTGIGGTAQTIDVGTIAAGSAKTFDFDRLGVSFTLNNANATAVNAESFEAYTPKANTLVVESAMDGEALFQVGAGTRDNVVIDGFKDIRITGYNNNANTSEKLVFDNINTTLNTIAQNTTESLSEANFATLENQIEAAITTISDFRSYLGAQQNRIEFAISNIQAQSENLTAANSRIVDTDYAAETANLTKTQIMQQAATAMLAQANQMPNVILALLK